MNLLISVNQVLLKPQAFAVVVVVVAVMPLMECLAMPRWMFPLLEQPLLLLTDFPIEFSFDVASIWVCVCHFQPPHKRRRTVPNSRFDQPIDNENCVKMYGISLIYM